ncbi:dirigent protein 4 [Jatropha curcas]|uniref:dirigent protein 4 n=1 Tax=Jatropha curcas TaxID=180498 RepID=UPI001893FDC6|nr:dirigent protein 4 [Jatropha curcas]
MEGKFSFVWAMILYVIMIAHAQGNYYSESIPADYNQQKITNLHFFFHETVNGKHPSAVQYKQVGVEPTSQVIGRAKGLYVIAGQGDDFSLVMYVDFGFITETKRELAVVGGRGQFKMARGFAELYSRYFNVTAGDAIVEYTVTLFHHH